MQPETTSYWPQIVVQSHYMPMATYRKLEAAGCAFLPAAGYANGGYSTTTSLSGACETESWNIVCCYWTSDNDKIGYDKELGVENTAYVYTMTNDKHLVQKWQKNVQCSVRLFMDAPAQ